MSIDLPAAWKDDCGVPLAASDLNQIRDAVVALDGWTAGRRQNACPSSGPQTSGDAAEWHTRGDYRQSWWGLYYRAGMTTLTITGVCAYQLDIYLGGTLNSSQAAAPGGFTKNITLSGYSDGDVILIEIRTNGNPATAPAGYTPKYLITDVYASPIVVSSTWSGVPTFAGTYNAARLNQLRDAAQYIWDRVTAVPILPQVAQIYSRGSHKTETIHLFDGSVGRYASNEVLRVSGVVSARADAETLEIYYNGSLAASDSYVAGQSAVFTHPITLTHTLGSRAEVSIRQVVTNDTNSRAVPSNFSTYTFTAIRSEADGSGYATAAPPTAWTAEESISQATLDSRLNALATMLSNAKARLDARPELWNRARAFRRTFAKDKTQVSRNRKRHSAMFQRQGDTLIVRGKGVKIGYGAIVVDTPGENEAIDYNKFKFATEQTIGTEDKISTSVVLLDTLPGLEPGMLFFVFNEGAEDPVEFAAEYLS